MKAWMVHDGEGSVIVFEETRGKAQARGANELGRESFFDVQSVRQMPHLDSYYPGPVPVEVLLADGWFFWCAKCPARIDEDSEGYVIKGQHIWCSDKCAEKERGDE